MKIFDPQLTGSIEVENPISGSVTTLGNVIALGSDSSLTGSFTGSFKGDGSDLVGVIVDSGSWDGIFTGSAAISGSLNISGAEAIQLTVEKRIRGQYYSVYNSTAATYAGYLITSGDFEDDATTDLGLASGTGRNIRFYTANNPVEKMRLTTDGNLGIGIAPSSTTSLHIYKSDPILLIQASNTSGDAELQFFPRDGSNVAHLQSIKGEGSSLVFSTGGNSGNSYVPTEALTISSGGDATFSGNVEVIKSSIPTIQLTQSGATNYKGYIKLAGNDLEIRGSSGAMEFYNGSVDGNSSALRLSISSTGAATFSSSLAGFGATITNNNDSSQGLLVRTSDNDGDEYILDLQSSSSATGTDYSSKFKVAKGGAATFSGDVLINNTNNNPRIELKQSGTTAGYFAIASGVNSIVNGSVSGDMTFRAVNKSVLFSVDNGVSSALTITSGGNVGIGTDNPSGGVGTTSTGTLLDVYDGTVIGNNGGALVLSGLGNASRKLNLGQIRTILTNGTVGVETSDMTFSTMSAAALTERMRITSGGKVNIGQGTSITGFLNIEEIGNHLHLRNGNAASGRYWNFDVDGNSRLYVLTNANVGVYLDYASTSWSAYSDESLKENIKPLSNVLDKIKDYRCVEYNLKSDDTKGKKIGFIAQDWENDFDPIISKDDEGLLGMKYTETIPVLLKAIQEQQAQIEELKSEIQLLKNN